MLGCFVKKTPHLETYQFRNPVLWEQSKTLHRRSRNPRCDAEIEQRFEHENGCDQQQGPRGRTGKTRARGCRRKKPSWQMMLSSNLNEVCGVALFRFVKKKMRLSFCLFAFDFRSRSARWTYLFDDVLYFVRAETTEEKVLGPQDGAATRLTLDPTHDS